MSMSLNVLLAEAYVGFSRVLPPPYATVQVGVQRYWITIDSTQLETAIEAGKQLASIAKDRGLVAFQELPVKLPHSEAVCLFPLRIVHQYYIAKDAFETSIGFCGSPADGGANG
jgi:hypothetical protein